MTASLCRRALSPCTRWCCPITTRCSLVSTMHAGTRSRRHARFVHTTSKPVATPSQQPTTASVSVPQLLSHLSALTSPSNPVRGNAFEHVSLALLTALPLALRLSHTGQSNDQGVDLLGSLPPHATLVCQCKMEGKPTGAAALRGLEGTVGQYASGGGGGGGVVGMLVSAQPYTQQAEAQWRRSALPLLLVTVDTQAAHAIAEVSDAERMQASELREALLRCLRRFSLNPAAAALLPHIRVVKQTLGTSQPYIVVKQAA